MFCLSQVNLMGRLGLNKSNMDIVLISIYYLWDTFTGHYRVVAKPSIPWSHAASSTELRKNY